MKIKQTRILAVILIIVLIAASAMLYSCEKDEGEVLGSGKTSFKLEITDNNGKTETFTVKTDEKILGDALIAIDFLTPDTKDAGYFDTLNGVKADWEVDEGWWGFYADGEMVSFGVFDAQAEINKNSVYSFKYEIGFDMSGWDEDFDGHDHNDPDHTH